VSLKEHLLSKKWPLGFRTVSLKGARGEGGPRDSKRNVSIKGGDCLGDMLNELAKLKKE